MFGITAFLSFIAGVYSTLAYVMTASFTATPNYPVEQGRLGMVGWGSATVICFVLTGIFSWLAWKSNR